MRDNLFRLVDKLYVIIYARLSKEEEGKTKEEKSKSIQNQIDICKRFIEDEKLKYPEIHYEIVKVLFDDGVSGTTFLRCEFIELIKMIENKKANMVITKDQSRFGREHIETDNYMEKWFPEHNIRYVSVLDGVDTYVVESANNDMAPIKNWMNEMYAKHTSRAVKATKRENAKKGIWNGGEPPLGLQIDKDNLGSLIIEPTGEEIVKNNIKKKIDKSKNAISKLNNEIDRMYKRLDVGIISEDQYKRLRDAKEKEVDYHKKNILNYEKELQDKVKNNEEIDYEKRVKELISLKNINKLLITKLIKKIYISEEKKVEIYYKVNKCY